MLATLKKVEARGALETLKRVRQRASDIFLYAIATGRVENNPVTVPHPKKDLPPGTLHSILKQAGLK
ncbi:MAG: type II toxin-antitoxin system HicA family toxin [Proteobacteria bacterium]|nr:type II toxin-antitoxin system HicA family toxin [Pseudomonadota bacterium]